MCERTNLTYLDDFSSFLKTTTAKMSFVKVVYRVSIFLTDANSDLGEHKGCGCRYFRASYPSWKNLLEELHRLTAYLRDSEFPDLEILYENPTERNAMKAAAIYMTLRAIITNIDRFSFYVLKEFEHLRAEHILINNYMSMIKENLISIAARHHSNAQESHFEGTETSRVINMLSGGFDMN